MQKKKKGKEESKNIFEDAYKAGERVLAKTDHNSCDPTQHTWAARLAVVRDILLQIYSFFLLCFSYKCPWDATGDRTEPQQISAKHHCGYAWECPE